MSKLATLEPAVKHDCATHQRFVGGPFHGRVYHEKLSMPVGAAEGTYTLTIPSGMDFTAALIWARAVVRPETAPRPSEPAQFVNYANRNGQWVYVPSR
jgi:hypothetical protein